MADEKKGLTPSPERTSFNIPEKKGLLRSVIIAGVAALYLWSARGTEFNPINIVRGIPDMVDFAMHMFPPDIGILKDLGRPSIETIQIALLGTTIPAFLAIPLGFLAASNTSPSRFMYYAVRSLLNTLRGISEVIWAILFVTAVGLGSYPGVLALSVHASGALGKFYSETIEAVDPGIIEAIKATGASRFKIILYAILPQCLPLFLGYSLYYWEHNLRQAPILGLVGAGGIGMSLIFSMKTYEYQQVATILIIMLVMVTGLERISARIRARVI